MEHYEEDILADTLREIIEIEKDVEQRKNKLSLKSDFNLHDFFLIFDTNNNRQFNFRHFEEVYNIYKLYPEIEYLRLAYRNIDRDLDGIIKLDEFLKEICPKDNNYRDLLLTRESYNDGLNFQRGDAFTP